ncbi:protein ENHANCED DOWNY MILDEW 2-like isoform X2 [Phoenix dactylifera]|uniref:Protein ENHANCED DOWNY MILDEW 2-like isoform X2 n=1 Tax=Phoenix dactylifera TaxID=42345 RepID=A0A8B7MVZ8_PHODC|nr:protein ENHANCED DOWNY MILDEW 2-like isoform X2 [Phoenix dactylifera]
MAKLLLEFLNEVGADLCDSVCAICDDGGELLCCEGRCMRSFHATESAGEDSGCNSLGYSKAQVEAIQIFLCKNCQYNQHQCFACGKLGSSDKSAGAEVFCCVSATCGHFYHPKCVAELLCPDNKSKASKYQKRIAAGKSFTCPVHKCVVCRQRENKEFRELQFAMCRRCPKSYHRKCLPREIAFEDTREGTVQRAWDGLLPNCTLIYCLNHTVMEELTTPARDHVIFPDVAGNKKIMVMQKKELEILAKKTSQIVNKLQCYVQHGDMIVDLCCDANAFSQLMKEKLDASGKICHFQSCDIIQPKNFCNFEKRDWLHAKPGELSIGSKLIMVLNPPSGVKATDANKFIDKALTFKPKLLILTVPEETERLDRKSEPYDLIWEDSEMLSDKSFSLSGSVDVNDHQAEQGNLKPPVLYLWSHPTWTKIYEDIAMEHGHTSPKHRQHCAEEESQMQRLATAPLVEEDAEECRKKDATPDEGARICKKRPSSENHEGVSCKKTLKSKHNPCHAEEESRV